MDSKMPKHKVIQEQARKMIYDVNTFLTTETDVIVGDLKEVKKTTADTATTLEKNLKTCIETLMYIVNRTTNMVDKSVLTETCQKLELIQEETAGACRSNELTLQRITNTLKQNQKRTSLATNTSVATVRRILLEADSGESVPVFKTPGKKRPRSKPVTDLNEFDKGIVKRTIHSFYHLNKELPAIEKLRKKLEGDIHFEGSETSLRRIIRDLGFRSKKAEHNKTVLIEPSDIRLQRIEFLQKLKKYRGEGRTIIYTNESYVASNSNFKVDVATKGQRVVLLHAGSEAGFVPNALLTLKVNSKSDTNHDFINFETYENWLLMQLVPNIPNNSVVVVGNASHHNKQFDLAPTANSTKAEMQAWLSKKGIEYDVNLLKPQLYKLIKENKDKFKKFSIARILAENNHNVLRLPPFHPDLNPLTLACSAINQYVGSKMNKWNYYDAINLVAEKVKSMKMSDWEIFCNRVKAVEEEYSKSDHFIDILSEQFVFIGSDDSDSEHESEEEENKSSGQEEMSSASTSGTPHQPFPFIKCEIMEEGDIKPDI